MFSLHILTFRFIITYESYVISFRIIFPAENLDSIFSYIVAKDYYFEYLAENKVFHTKSLSKFISFN